MPPTPPLERERERDICPIADSTSTRIDCLTRSGPTSNCQPTPAGTTTTTATATAVVGFFVQIECRIEMNCIGLDKRLKHSKRTGASSSEFGVRASFASANPIDKFQDSIVKLADSSTRVTSVESCRNLNSFLASGQVDEEDANCDRRQEPAKSAHNLETYPPTSLSTCAMGSLASAWSWSECESRAMVWQQNDNYFKKKHTTATIGTALGDFLNFNSI